MKLINILVYYLIIFCFLACDKEQTPFIKDEIMVNVLVDVHFAEAAVQHLTGIRKDTTLKKYYAQILEIQGVNQVDFDSSYNLITINPDYVKRIYQQVQDSIQVRNLNSTK
ncbi:MAG: DUF4296 domain-containing protein [Bacteroidetes bacterium]|jgi:hypothetical protein|nr:DUF4296 domain-containing protein [Bacteroidota bacterium]MDF1865747.1 DUF4296 domain-containing protein [Saprospiraceae bacterium]